MKKKVIILTFITVFILQGIKADTFTENFDNANYKDTTQTTTNWPAVVDLKNVTVLNRENKFVETTGVINWGGGITAIDCNSSAGKWLIGGEGGKLNEYDGNNFINHSTDLIGFGTADIGAIRYNGSYWLIGSGTTAKINKWDGNNWSDLSSSLIGFSTGIYGMDYDSGNGYWLIVGGSGAINKYDGTTWTDLKTAAGFGTSDIRAVRYNGSYWLVAGKDGKIKRYNGSSWTDLTANLEVIWDPAPGNVYYDIYALDWDGTNNVWVIGGGSGKLATYNGTNFTDKSSSVSMSTIWSIHYNGSYNLIGGVYGGQTRLYTTSDNSTYYLQSNPAYFNTDPIWAIKSNGSGINLIGGRNGRLMKREGGVNTPTNTNLSNSMRDFGKLNINAIRNNGSYWLIGGVDASINKYDGEVYVDLKAGLTTAGWGASEDIMAIGWNGSYWLIGGTNGSLCVYDGVSFTSKTSQLGFGTDTVYVIEWGGTSGNEQWIIGGSSRKLKVSADGNTYTTVDISSYFGATDAVLAASWAGTPYDSWFIGGDNGSIIKYDGSTISDLKPDLYSAIGGYYKVNAIKWDSGVNSIIRVGCNGAKLADYSIFNFTDMSGNLIGFGTNDIKAIDYNAASGKWFIVGTGGKINSDTGGTFADESGNLVNFGGMDINAIRYNGDYWMIGGNYAKINRYGLAYKQSGWAVSTAIDHYGYKYECATLTAVDVLNGQKIEYYISSNNGGTWIQVTPGIGVCFSGVDQGEDIRWKAYLYTYDLLKSPYIDSVTIEYSRLPAPTYTITPTHTDSPTLTITPTITQTHTNTPTLTITQTITQTVTPTITNTITQTITETVTPTISATNTETITPTVTNTVTQTITETVTPTISATNTQTITPTVTRTNTQTITQTATPTITQTITETVTKTVTTTMTQTITLTITMTITVTTTQTITNTITHTVTFTITKTVTPTVTETATQSITSTITETATITETLTNSPVHTFTATATLTVTLTWTSSPTHTPNPTNVFYPGSLIIPMDTASGRTNQDYGMWRAYGLVYKLLQNGIPVYWAIKSYKSYEEIDFTCSQTTDIRTGVVYNNPSYNGGPFIIAASNSTTARSIIDTWNQGQSNIVQVHQYTGTGTFQAPIYRVLKAAPSIAVLRHTDPRSSVFQDAFNYLNSAGIPDSRSFTWSTASPDFITLTQTAGTFGSQHDGILFIEPGGLPKYSTLIVMHWAAYPVGEYGGGGSTPPLNDYYAGRVNSVIWDVTFEAIKEMDTYLHYPGAHIYAQCIAVDALENNIISTTPSAQDDWIYGGYGHWLTTNGFIDTNDNITVTANVLPDSPFGQATGKWSSASGSQTAFGLKPNSVFYGGTSSVIQINLDPVTRFQYPYMFMSGYYKGVTTMGRVSYMSQHNMPLNLPYSSNNEGPAARYFYNSLFNSPDSSETVPKMYISKSGPLEAEVNSNITYTIYYSNVSGIAYDVILYDTIPANASFVSCSNGCSTTITPGVVIWNLGNLLKDTSGSVSVTFHLNNASYWDNNSYIRYRCGTTIFYEYSNTIHTLAVVFTPTATITPTITSTITKTITPTVTQTMTKTVTLTITETATQTITQTITPTITHTSTMTVTQTITPTITITNTVTITPTITTTYTHSSTPTISPTHSNTPPFTATATPSITVTFTDSMTQTITSTITNTLTETVTKTITDTITMTITFTTTPTITETYTQTITSTITDTITETHTITETFTITNTYTITQTHTITPTITLTLTFTITQTPMPYLSPTITPTFTATPGQIIVYPNPFNSEKAVNGTLKIEYLPENTRVSIYTVHGFKVYYKENTNGRIEWDGKNMEGEKVAPGIYFYIIETKNEKIIGKLFITK